MDIFDNSELAVAFTNKLFVYGTLKKGFRNHEPIAQAKFIEEYKGAQGVMFHLSLFPGISLAEPRTPIQGEIYEVNAGELDKCDTLEGVKHGYFYQRTLMWTFEHGFIWVYAVPREKVEHSVQSIKFWVPTGKWIGAGTIRQNWTGFHFDKEKELPLPEGGTYMDAQYWKVPSVADKGEYYLVHKQTKRATGPFKFTGEFSPNGKPKVQILPRKTVVETVRDFFVGPQLAKPLLLPAPEPKAPRIGPGVKQV